MEELEQEIEKRKKEASKPQPVENPDFSPVLSICEKYIQGIIDGTYHEDNDDIHYMFETCMEVVYGKKIFDWIKKNIR